jgi:hypothetical protein
MLAARFSKGTNMLPIAIALTAASAISTASLPPTPQMPSLDHHSLCGAGLDPEFVHFVPPAPTSGRNPLFRLISGSPNVYPTADPGAGIRACRQMLTRWAPLR